MYGSVNSKMKMWLTKKPYQDVYIKHYFAAGNYILVSPMISNLQYF